MAFAIFHFTTWLSRNSDVYALPRLSNVVWSGPSPTSGSATIFSVFVSMIVTVGESLPLATRYFPSGVAFTPCGFLGTGIRVSTPATVSGSIIGTPLRMVALPAATACSAAGMSIAATASRSYWSIAPMSLPCSRL